MLLRPFLTQFVVKRYDVPDVTRIRLKYDQERDYNEFTCSSGLTEYQDLSTKTYTNIKTERPDNIQMNSSLRSWILRSGQLELFNTHHYTMLALLLSTLTYTCVRSESTDNDR